MRILHSGNVANNAYLNAKLMRRAGVAADALCDEWHILSQPEWEDAPLEPPLAEYAVLTGLARRAGWVRPEWALSPRGTRETFAGSWVSERAWLAAVAPRLVPQYLALRREYEPLRSVLGTELSFFDVLRGAMWANRLARATAPLDKLFRAYDFVQANGLHPVLTLLHAPLRPFVAFEHGTMRELPFEDLWSSRLLALAYRRAGAVIITNADVIAAARRLALERIHYVPHPIDETKYAPGHSALRRRLSIGDDRLLLFSPSSQNWGIKGNDRLLRGFAAFVRLARPDALLVLTEWGLEIERSRELIRELGVDDHVRWLPPLPKVHMIDAYRGADLVLDQFLIGTFGAVAPEAMACGTPVVMAFDDEVHRWCYDELPPVVKARTPEEIYEALVRLGDAPEERDRIGRESRRWVERHHGWRLVVSRQLAVYEAVLEFDERSRAKQSRAARRRV